MKIGSMNVRGLGCDAKKDDVAIFLMKNNLDFCCLQETKMASFSDHDGRRIWKDKDFGWCAEGAVGRSGGILTCWDARKFTCLSAWNLGGAVIINGWWEATREEIYIINVYAPCCRDGKRRLWDSLGLVLSQSSRVAACLIGDFNSILDSGERSGSGWRMSSREISEFKNFVEENSLQDLGLQGRKYTWYRSNGKCKSRIDRALINDKWAETWSNSGLRGLPRTISDHCAIIMQTKHEDWGAKPFRFVNAWLSHPQFREVVEKSWREGGLAGWGGYVVKEKLKRLKEDLKRWNRDHFGHIDNKIQAVREEIQKLDECDDKEELSDEGAARRREASAQLILHMNNRRSLLAQKARIRWLREGDVNSKIFHKAIQQRRVANGITGLEVDGLWCEEPLAVKAAIKGFFKSQFGKKEANMVEMPTDLFESRLDEAEGELLTREFSEEEIKEAIWDCDNSKSPGPDGFGLDFFKHSWETIKEDLIRFFAEFHVNGKLVRGLNSSFVALIPKREGGHNLNHYRPISLIGSTYKILAKVLARRMKTVLGKVIGESQSAFLKGRFILDGVVALNEAIEDAKKSKKKRLLFKVDFAKAFDSVSWEFLLKMLENLNFPTKWVLWMKECISTANANVLVNGSPSGEFELQRGLRQGDPLSPFLFLVAAEGLNLLVKRAVTRKMLQAAHIGRDNVQVSHVQYADDTMFIVEGEKMNAKAILWILKLFESASGLAANFDKCWAFGVNMGIEEVVDLVEGLGCRVGMLPAPYLGLKVGGRLAGAEGWGDVFDKVKGRIRWWDNKLLSMGGRITAIKSVTSAMPVYGLSMFPLSKKIAQKFRSLQCNFLWGGKDGSRKLAWINWDALCRPKNEGGLGFKDLISFNRTLLNKWVWRFLTGDGGLWRRIIISRHGLPSWAPNGTRERRAGRETGWWKRIVKLVDGIDGKWFWDKVERIIGDGKDTFFWDDKWAGGSSLKARFPRLFHLCRNPGAKISEMGDWAQGAWRWKFNWRRPLRDSEEEWITELLQIIQDYKPVEGKADRWSWGRTGDGSFSVKKAYLELETHRRAGQ